MVRQAIKQFTELTAGQKVLCGSAAFIHVLIGALVHRLYEIGTETAIISALQLLLGTLISDLLCIMSKDVPDKLADAVLAWVKGRNA